MESMYIATVRQTPDIGSTKNYNITIFTLRQTPDIHNITELRA